MIKRVIVTELDKTHITDQGICLCDPRYFEYEECTENVPNGTYYGLLVYGYKNIDTSDPKHTKIGPWLTKYEGKAIQKFEHELSEYLCTSKLEIQKQADGYILPYERGMLDGAIGMIEDIKMRFLK